MRQLRDDSESNLQDARLAKRTRLSSNLPIFLDQTPESMQFVQEVVDKVLETRSLVVEPIFCRKRGRTPLVNYEKKETATLYSRAAPPASTLYY